MATTDFYPSSMDARRAWHANLAAQIGAFAAKYNLTLDQLANVTNDNAWVQYWVQARHEAEEIRKQLTKYFNDIAGNNPSLDPPKPINFALTGTAPAEVLPGIEFRTREIARQIKNHSAYAEADGVLLGIVASTTPPPESEVKPTIEAFAAKHGYLASVVVGNRGESDQWQVKVRPAGGSNWITVETATGKSTDFTYSPATHGVPVQLDVFVQLRKANADYGQPSDIVQVTVNP